MTHNYGRFIAAAIESIVNQELSDWELVISDDASTDNTAEIVAPYLADARIQYVHHEKNLGQSANWAFVLSQGTAPLVAVLHADDVWMPSMLSSAVEAFQQNPKLEIYSANWFIMRDEVADTEPDSKMPSRTMTGPEAYDTNLGGNFLLPSSAVLSRGLIQRAGLPSTTLNQFVDFEYALRLFSHAEYVQRDAVPRFFYRIHAASGRWVNASLRDAGEFEMLPQICRSHPSSNGESPRRERRLKFIAGRGIRSLGVKECKREQWDVGSGLFSRALAICPPGEMYLRIAADNLLSKTGAVGRKVFRKIHK